MQMATRYIQVMIYMPYGHHMNTLFHLILMVEQINSLQQDRLGLVIRQLYIRVRQKSQLLKLQKSSID